MLKTTFIRVAPLKVKRFRRGVICCIFKAFSNEHIISLTVSIFDAHIAVHFKGLYTVCASYIIFTHGVFWRHIQRTINTQYQAEVCESMNVEN